MINLLRRIEGKFTEIGNKTWANCGVFSTKKDLSSLASHYFYLPLLFTLNISQKHKNIHSIITFFSRTSNSLNFLCKKLLKWIRVTRKCNQIDGGNYGGSGKQTWTATTLKFNSLEKFRGKAMENIHFPHFQNFINID